jgi:hypothetical protein
MCLPPFAAGGSPSDTPPRPPVTAHQYGFFRTSSRARFAAESISKPIQPSPLPTQRPTVMGGTQRKRDKSIVNEI